MIWRDQILTYATAYGLEGIIDGLLQLPPRVLDASLSLNPTFLNWNRLNWIVKGWIYGSVHVNMLGHLSCGMTAREQCIALEDSFSTNV